MEKLTDRQEEIINRIRQHPEASTGWFYARAVGATKIELAELALAGYLDSSAYAHGRAVAFKLIQNDETIPE